MVYTNRMKVHHFDQQNLLWRMLWTCQNCVHKVQIVCTKWWEQEVGCFEFWHLALRPHVFLNLSYYPYFMHYSHCTMGWAPLKSGIRGIYRNVSLRPHFYQSQLFQTNYLEIVLCPVSLLIHTWGLVEHSPLQKKNLQ